MKNTPAAKDLVELDLLRRSAKGDTEAFENLLRRSAKGDTEAFEKLYHLTAKLVHQYLCRVFSVRGLADTTLTETYIEAWSNLRNYRGNVKVSLWLVGIARTLAMRKLSRGETKKLIDKQLIAEASNTNPESLDKQRLLNQAMKALPLNQREILGLILLPNFSYHDISKLLRIPPADVRRKVFQAKEALKLKTTAAGDHA
jgi:RNA polymerase sigma-70 factor (ECF subfamily)